MRRLAALLFDTFTTTAGMPEWIDAESPVNGAVFVDCAPRPAAHDGRLIVTGAGPAGAAVVGVLAAASSLCSSPGFGDARSRPTPGCPGSRTTSGATDEAVWTAGDAGSSATRAIAAGADAVSYTHLTLPTIHLV